MWILCDITGLRGRLLLLCVVVFSCGTAFGASDANEVGGGDVNAPAVDVNEAISEVNEPVVVLKDSNSPFVADPNLTLGTGLDTGDMFYKMIGAVLLVAVLGGAALYLSKRVLPRISNVKGKQVRVLETVHLGQHKALHLVKAGNQRFLLGSTSERITRLAAIGDELSEMDFLEQDSGEAE